MKQFRIDNDSLSGHMKRSLLKMPTSDLEEKIMYKISQEQRNRSIHSNFKISFLFFLLATILGSIINSTLYEVNGTFFSIPTETLRLAFQVAFTALFLSQLEKYFKRLKISK